MKFSRSYLPDDFKVLTTRHVVGSELLLIPMSRIRKEGGGMELVTGAFIYEGLIDYTGRCYGRL